MTARERQEARHQAALERIAAEKAASEARTAALAAKWKQERQAQCGTPSGYQRHRRNDETPCQACKDANRDYNRQKDAQRKERANQRKREKRQAAGATPRVLRPCGTTAAARRHRRKGEELCGPCREAYRENMRELNERRNKLRVEGKTLQQVSAQKRAAIRKRELEERLSNKDLMACCGAPITGDEGTAKYAKRHWVEKTDLCDPARQCRNLSDRLRWIQKYGEPRRLAPCGTTGAFKRHQRAGEEPCQPCRDAHNARKRDYDREYRRREPTPEPEPEPVVERMPCCDAPVDGSERTGKYSRRHNNSGTNPCPAARECRNRADRKIYSARKSADDVRERRRTRRQNHQQTTTRKERQ